MSTERVIRVEGIIVEVNEEIYITYYKMGRRERYFKETSMIREISFEFLTESGRMPFDSKTPLDYIIKAEEIRDLNKSLSKLDAKEQQLLQLLYFDELTEREAARVLHIGKSTLRYRKEKVLRKLQEP